MSMSMPPRLEHWSIEAAPLDPYKDPTLGQGIVARGIVYGHALFDDGVEILTSAIRSMDTETSSMHTVRTQYTLGRMSPSYQKWRVAEGLGERVWYADTP